MGNTLANIKLVLQLLPLIIDAVSAIENALPEGGTGKAKLGLVREVIQAGFDTATDVVVSFDQVWPIIEKTVGAIVSTFNAVGKFKK